MIRVQQVDLDPGEVLAQIRKASRNAGALVSFVGLVREFSQGKNISSMTLEHYPGMTEATLQKIEDDALKRWDLMNVYIIHRFGHLKAGENIVMVATASAHRIDAFEAAQYIMDALKTDAPFWKKEHSDQGDHWVASRDADLKARQRWQDESG